MIEDKIQIMDIDFVPMYEEALTGNLVSVDVVAKACLYGSYVPEDREKAKYYFKEIASRGYQRIHWDNYGNLLTLIGVIHFEDDEDEEARHWFLNALDFYQNYLPPEIGREIIEEHSVIEYLEDSIKYSLAREFNTSYNKGTTKNHVKIYAKEFLHDSS